MVKRVGFAIQPHVSWALNCEPNSETEHHSSSALETELSVRQLKVVKERLTVERKSGKENSFKAIIDAVISDDGTALFCAVQVRSQPFWVHGGNLFSSAIYSSAGMVLSVLGRVDFFISVLSGGSGVSYGGTFWGYGVSYFCGKNHAGSMTKPLEATKPSKQVRRKGERVYSLTKDLEN